MKTSRRLFIGSAAAPLFVTGCATGSKARRARRRKEKGMEYVSVENGRRSVTCRSGGVFAAAFAFCLPLAVIGQQVKAAVFPFNPNRTLVSAYRPDIVGPEVWTASFHTGPLEGTAETYWRSEVPFLLFGKPAPGLSGRLHVVHQVKGANDVFVPVVEELSPAGTAKRIAFVPVRHRWTPAFMTTYYRGEPTELAADEGSRVGATVLKETKAILEDNTFVVEAVLKNTLSEPRAYRIGISCRAGLPECGSAAAEWRFTTVYMKRDNPGSTYVASGATFPGDSCEVKIPPHGETTFRYALSFAPRSAEAAAEKLGKALAKKDPFAENERAFNSWFEREVPVLETSDPDLYRMYCYRWFVVKRSVHTARDVIAGHPYPRTAVYESPVGGWSNCVIGLPVPVQLRELRWMKTPGTFRDHALNWCDKVKGYRGYIQFTGEAMSRIQENHPSAAFARRVYPAVRDYALRTSGGDPSRLPVQRGSWPTGAEYQPNFYQFTEPRWDYRHDAQFGPEKGFTIARSVRLDTACYAIGNLRGAARLARIAGEGKEAEKLGKLADAHLGIVLKRHWDDRLGLFLAADPETYRLADQAPCYDSFAPYQWGLVSDVKYLRAFDKFIDRAWFWDDFPGTTCAKTCPMYYGANGIVFPPAATPSRPLPKVCCWNGPVWHYANTLYAEAFGRAAGIRTEFRGKWVEFFDAWTETHWAYGDRGAPRAAEHFRPEDGARCGTTWDYFHSAWLDPFILYRCGASISEDLKTLRFDPYAAEDFRLSGVPFAGRLYAFEQKKNAAGRPVRTVYGPDGRVLATGEGVVSVPVSPLETPFEDRR